MQYRYHPQAGNLKERAEVEIQLSCLQPVPHANYFTGLRNCRYSGPMFLTWLYHQAPQIHVNMMLVILEVYIETKEYIYIYIHTYIYMYIHRIICVCIYIYDLLFGDQTLKWKGNKATCLLPGTVSDSVLFLVFLIKKSF